jgi:hypothetical protein
MNAFDLEQIRKETIDKLNLSKSPRQILYVLNIYFDKILSSNNSLFISSFLIEFIDDYINSFRMFSPIYTPPEFTNNILLQAKVIAGHPALKEYQEILKTQIEIITQELNELLSSLNGTAGSGAASRKVIFPVLEDTGHLQNDIRLGLAETASITIKHLKNADKDNFVIVPSPELIEKNLLEQIKISWHLALKYAAKYIRKPAVFHEVIIQFNSRSGEYIGESLGAAITLMFLEELLKFYNSPYHITPASKIAITGGISIDGMLKPVSENIIKQKTEVLFYSDLSTFVVPADDAKSAEAKFNELNKGCPGRSLKIIPAKDFNDIIDRRNLVDFKKDNLIITGGRYFIRNRVSTIIILVLISVISYFLVAQYDNNPAIYDINGNILTVKNKSSKFLWSKNIAGISDSQLRSELVKIVKNKDDDKNEVLICQETIKDGDSYNNFKGISCYNYNGRKLLWQYQFEDTASYAGGRFSNNYVVFIIDTFSVNSEQRIALFARNCESYASAVFILNLSNGKREKGTLWCSGFIESSILKDINNDGKLDLIGVGLDNGFEESVMFGIPLSDLDGCRMSTKNYNILYKKPADLIFYIRFPKTDYLKYRKYRMENLTEASLTDTKDEHTYSFRVNEGAGYTSEGITYSLNYNFKDVGILIGNNFRVRRDSLVAHGILPLPYTDTEAYKDLLKSQILYWTGSKWVNKAADK